MIKPKFIGLKWKTVKRRGWVLHFSLNFIILYTISLITIKITILTHRSLNTNQHKAKHQIAKKETALLETSF